MEVKMSSKLDAGYSRLKEDERIPRDKNLVPVNPLLPV
jgi:hypothetical protein